MRSTSTKYGISKSSSWPIGPFLLMDMCILSRGPKHVFFWPIKLTRMIYLTNTPSEVKQLDSKWLMGLSELNRDPKMWCSFARLFDHIVAQTFSLNYST